MTITRTITSYICDETKQIFVEKEHSLSFEGYTVGKPLKVIVPQSVIMEIQQWY